MTPHTEKRLLQIIVALGCLVPLAAGGVGVVQGVGLIGGAGVDLDSHFRYLSGLLLGIGLAFASLVPRIEREGARARMLTMIVVIGGFGRACAWVAQGQPGNAMAAALVMEWAVTPLLYAWQRRVARRCSRENAGDLV